MSQASKRSRPSSTSHENSSKRQKRSTQDSLALTNGDTEIPQYTHKKGSVVRVAMHNFVTYDDCEFFPGPLLNVVIGPNGSGKSSIVCGLVLGLGGSPKLLGRAKQLKEFIRHGHTEAWVELELARARNNKNVILRRTIRANNTSEWHLNNVMTSMTEVKNLIESLNIQIDNVCQFLPQDKVVEFAKLDQFALLRETEKAVGPVGMIDDHDNLVKMYKSKCDDRLEMDTKTKHLADLRAKNEVLERDVIRFRERERLLKKANDMKLKRPWIEYREHNEQATAAHQRHQQAEERYQKAKKSCIPLETEVNALAVEVEKVEHSRRKRQEKLAKFDADRKKFPLQLRTYEERYQDAERELQKLLRSVQNREQEAQQTAIEIEKMETRLESLHAVDVEAELRGIAANKNELIGQENMLRETQNHLNNLQRDHERQLGDLNHELKEMDNAEHRRERLLQSSNQDAYSAYEWIKAQSHRFHDKVHGPVALAVKVPDPYHAQCFENQVSRAVLFTFLAVNDHDYDLMMNELFSKQKLKINLARAHQIQGSFHPSDDIENLRRFGLQAWLSSCVEAEDIVLRFLCANSAVHLAGVGGADTNHHQIFDNSSVTRVFTPQSVYTGTRSRYGNRNRSVRVEGLRRASIISSGVDMERRRTLQAQQQHLQEERNGTAKKLQEVNHQLREVEIKLEGLEKRRRELQNTERERTGLASRIRSKQERLEALRHEEDTSAREAEIKAGMNKNLEKQAEIATRMTEFMKQFTALALQLDYHFITRMEKMQQHVIKKGELERKRREFEELEHEAKLAAAEFKELQTRARRAKQKAESEAPMTEALEELFATFPDDLDKLNNEIVQIEERANINYRSNPHLIEDYENRREEIAKVEKQLEDMKNNHEGNESRIETLKNKWLSSLKGLVTRINTSFKSYFRNIGCYGRVELAEDPDFSKYGLVIHVSFRAGQKPQILDACTQSGGERSVTTMLFLVSLQDLTECPFRLVDEINQGMDPTNERMIFEEVSKSACKADQPQFFLITPKLLPGLVFTPEMTVLCVMNGPWMLKQDEWETIGLHHKF